MGASDISSDEDFPEEDIANEVEVSIERPSTPTTEPKNQQKQQQENLDNPIEEENSGNLQEEEIDLVCIVPINIQKSQADIRLGRARFYYCMIF